MSIERGEVRWYAFEKPDKQRPVVILTRNSAIPYLNSVTVAPITRTIRSIPTEVPLDERDGVKSSCVINLDHVQTIPKKKIGSFITKLSHQKMALLREALSFAVGFDD